MLTVSIIIQRLGLAYEIWGRESKSKPLLVICGMYVITVLLYVLTVRFNIQTRAHDTHIALLRVCFINRKLRVLALDNIII